MLAINAHPLSVFFGEQKAFFDHDISHSFQLEAITYKTYFRTQSSCQIFYSCLDSIRGNSKKYNKTLFHLIHERNISPVLHLSEKQGPLYSDFLEFSLELALDKKGIKHYLHILGDTAAEQKISCMQIIDNQILSMNSFEFMPIVRNLPTPYLLKSAEDFFKFSLKQKLLGICKSLGHKSSSPKPALNTQVIRRWRESASAVS